MEKVLLSFPGVAFKPDIVLNKGAIPPRAICPKVTPCLQPRDGDSEDARKALQIKRLSFEQWAKVEIAALLEPVRKSALSQRTALSICTRSLRLRRAKRAATRLDTKPL